MLMVCEDDEGARATQGAGNGWTVTCLCVLRPR